MGSIGRGLLTGYLCRLCSKMNRHVILIYSKDGVDLDLVTKINKYLPVAISKSDPLPKTICLNCIDRLEKFHKMMKQIEETKEQLCRAMGNASRLAAGSNPKCSETQV